MDKLAQSTKELLKVITSKHTALEDVVNLSEKLLKQKILDQQTEKSVTDILQMTQIKILEKQLIEATEDSKDLLISKIIAICPLGNARDSFIRLLLDRKVKACAVEEIAILAMQASSEILRNEYLEEASLCLLRQVATTASLPQSIGNGEHTLLVKFLFSCYQLSYTNPNTHDIFNKTLISLLKFIDRIGSYALFEECIKMVNKLENKEIEFAQHAVAEAINLCPEFINELHSWFPFGAFIPYSDSPKLEKLFSAITNENKLLRQTLQQEPVEVFTVRGIKKPGVLKVIMLFPGVVKKFFIGDIYKRHYRNEAHALTLLNGTCAPKLLMSDFTDGVGIIVCERLNATTLLDQGVTMTPWPVLQKKLDQIFFTLHQHQLCHGDISCENIMQTDTGDLKLIDFESATVFDGEKCLDQKNITQLFEQLWRRYANRPL